MLPCLDNRKGYKPNRTSQGSVQFRLNTLGLRFNENCYLSVGKAFIVVGV